MSNGGMKFDGDKPNTQLLFGGMPLALLGVSAVLTFGAKKYEAHSWKTVPNNVERYKAAMIRHQLAIESGETHDSESGLPHAYHIACNALFLAELAAASLKRDERSERPAGAEPIQCASGSADDCRGDRQPAGDVGAVGGGAGRAETLPEIAERVGGGDVAGVRGGTDLTALLKQRASCGHNYMWAGIDGATGNTKYKCSLCGSEKQALDIARFL